MLSTPSAYNIAKCVVLLGWISHSSGSGIAGFWDKGLQTLE